MSNNHSYVITDYGPMKTFDPKQVKSKLENLETKIDALSGGGEYKYRHCS